MCHQVRQGKERGGHIDADKFVEAWGTCPNCGQRYQHERAVDLTNSLLSFIEGKYPEEQRCLLGKIRMVAALRLKLDAIGTMGCDNRSDLRAEVIKAAKKIMMVVEDIKIYLVSMAMASFEDVLQTVIGDAELFALPN